jgi:hypothetical protein
MYKLSNNRTGLHCSATGLTYGALPLVAKSASSGRFEPFQADQLHKIGLAISPSGLKAIAMALNDNSLTRAIVAEKSRKL